MGYGEGQSGVKDGVWGQDTGKRAMEHLFLLQICIVVYSMPDVNQSLGHMSKLNRQAPTSLDDIPTAMS